MQVKFLDRSYSGYFLKHCQKSNDPQLLDGDLQEFKRN